MTHAVTPAPDGGYAGLDTAEGQNALLGLTTGTREHRNRLDVAKR